MRQIGDARPDRGFTLIEILVALILIALLIGAVVPSVLNQVTKGETNRLLEDLDAVSTGMQTFRVDVNRWPGDLEDLIFRPVAGSSTDLDIDDSQYTTGMVNKWAGSYLDGVELTASGTLITGADGVIESDFDDDSYTLNGEKYVTVTVTGLPASQVSAIDVAVDGETDAAAGRIRTSSTIVYFLATPKR